MLWVGARLVSNPMGKTGRCPDHEVIHWGDPGFDVGFGLTHLLSKAHHLPAYRAALVRAARTVWQSYQDEIDGSPWQTGLEHHVVRHTLGCLLARVAGRSPLEYLTEHEPRLSSDVRSLDSWTPHRKRSMH